MNRLMQACPLLLVWVAAGCGARMDPETPGPAAEAVVTDTRPVNPCLVEEYVQLRRVAPARLAETDRRRLQEMEGACIDYRLAVARARESGGDLFVRPGADYRKEVLPWLAGMALFTGGLYLFIGGT